MSAIPIYEVEFIPLERRLLDRRAASRTSTLPSGVTADRRKASSRRADERKPAALNVL